MLKYVKEALKNSFIYGIGNISVKLVGFVLIPFLTNPEYLSTEDYGALGIFEAINQIVISLLGLGLYNSFLRWYYDQSDEDNKSTFFTASITVSAVTILAVALVYHFRFSLSNLIFSDESYSEIIVLVILTTGLQALGQLPASLMRIQERAMLFTGCNVFKLIITLVITLYLLFVHDNGLLAIYYGQIAGFTAYLLVLLPYTYKNSSFKFHAVVFTEMLSYGFSMMMAGIAASAINVVDRFVLNSMSGLEEVGLYSLSYKVASIIKILVISSVSLALTPLLFKKMHDPDSERFYSKTMTYYSFGISLCIMFVSIFSKELLVLVTGSSLYWSSYTIIPILCFSLFFVALKDIATLGLRLSKKTYWITIMTVVISILNLFLNIALIPFFAAKGAALASLISQIFFFGGLFYFSNKTYPIKFEWRKVIMIFVTTVGLVYLALLTNEINLAIRIIVKVSIISLFPIILYKLNFFEPIEISRIQSIWQQWKNPFDWKSNLKKLQ